MLDSVKRRLQTIKEVVGLCLLHEHHMPDQL